MHFEIDGNPDYGEVVVALSPGEDLLVDSGSMSRMSVDLDVRATTMGGLFKALGRKLFAGESLLLGRYHSDRGGIIALSPAVPGTVMHRELRGDSIFLTRGSFLACSAGIEIRTKFGGLKSLFSREGAFLIECSGSGQLFYNSFGAVEEHELDGELIVDTGHVVAWEPSLDYTIRGMGGLKQTMFSGEGLTMHFRGRGRLWLQTRTLPELAGWLGAYC
ncbi:MAG: TIGR00266 family protein [Planctomycetes bacterium]|nr:TIGR00266 family protein [Planctomycetota bacterium]